MAYKTISGNYQATIYRGGIQIALGSFPSKRRAELTELLTKHWLKCGVNPFDIIGTP